MVRSTLSIVATVAVWGFVATPLPAQTTTPATQPASTIEGAYEKLNSPLPADRNNARVELMGLHRNDLPTLKRVVESRLPVYPQQAVDLRDIVRHVYLAADVYPSSAEGFLGVATRGGQSSVVLQMPDGTAGGGVDLSEIYVGFAAYRWLQQGDVILSVGHANDETPVRVGATLTAAVKKIPPGDEVSLRVMRNGVVVTLHFPLNARPEASDLPQRSPDFMDDRTTRAEAYWREHFLPLIDADMT